MRSPETAYRDLISAAAGELSFDAAIASTVQHFSAGGGIVFELNRKTGHMLDWATPTLIVGGDGYTDRINAINPRMRFSLRHAAGHVAYEGRFISERGIDRHEFYDWLHDFEGFRYMLGSRVYDDGDVSLFYSVEFSRRQGHPEGNAIEAFSRIAPAVGHAWRLRRRVGANHGATQARTWLPDHLPWAVFALSATGTVVGMNAPARALIDRGTVVTVALDTLRATHRRSDAALCHAVRSALAGNAAEAFLETASGGPSFILQVLPVDPAGLCGSSGVAVLAYLKNPIDKARNIGPVLGRLYGLTPAEQKLADILATGADLGVAAAALCLSRNTVRNRMQAIYAKTGTRRQSEFLVRILGLLEP